MKTQNPGYTVHVINPKKGKRTVAKRRRKKTTMRRAAAPKRRRRRRANPGYSITEENPRRRRRRSGGAVGSRRRRRRNPGGPRIGGGSGVFGAFRGELGRQLGKMVTAFAIQRFGGGTGGLMGAGATSGFAGASWPLRNYLIGLLVAFGGPRLLRGVGMGKYASDFTVGAVTSIASKFLWTELFSKWGGTQWAFGNQQNSIVQDGSGTSWMLRDGQWVSMMGHGALVTSDALDGRMGALVEADQLDGMGHYMSPDSSARASNYASAQGTGSRNPYQAAYQD